MVLETLSPWESARLTENGPRAGGSRHLKSSENQSSFHLWIPPRPKEGGGQHIRHHATFLPYSQLTSINPRKSRSYYPVL